MTGPIADRVRQWFRELGPRSSMRVEPAPLEALDGWVDDVDAGPGEIVYDTVLSEEGGRFLHTRNRHLLVEPSEVAQRPGFLWLTLGEPAVPSPA